MIKTILPNFGHSLIDKNTNHTYFMLPATSTIVLIMRKWYSMKCLAHVHVLAKQTNHSWHQRYKYRYQIRTFTSIRIHRLIKQSKNWIPLVSFFFFKKNIEWHFTELFFYEFCNPFLTFDEFFFSFAASKIKYE